MITVGDLEGRLKEVSSPEHKDSLVFMLENRKYEAARSGDNPYYKYKLVDEIIAWLEDYAPVNPLFKANFDSTLNKYEMKRIFYGLVCMGGAPRQEVRAIVGRLTEWEKICFFAGVWKDRDMSQVQRKTVVELMFDYIKSGYDWLHRSHMINFNSGKYKRALKIPESQNYRQNMKPFIQAAKRFEELLAREKASGSDYDQESTAHFLYNCTDEERAYLTKEFGAEPLGGYAVNPD